MVRMAFRIRSLSLGAWLALAAPLVPLVLLPAAGCGAAGSGRTTPDGGDPDGAPPTDTGDGAGNGAPSFARDVAPLLEKRCTGYCHPGGYSPMSLRGDVSHAKLVGVPSVGCAGARVRVKPGSPDPGDSDLMAKVLGVEICGNGQRMPPVGAPLTEAELRVLRDWIAAGARND